MITQQPLNRSVETGQMASFSVAATGTAPLSYQWRKNGVTISGATASTYTTPATVIGDNGSTYSCVVTNMFGPQNELTRNIDRVVPPPVQSGNVLLNPGFESGTTSWALYSNGSAALASVSPGFEGSKTGRVSITTPGTNVQLYQINVPLDPNTDYTLTFAAYSNTGHDLSISLLQKSRAEHKLRAEQQRHESDHDLADVHHELPDDGFLVSGHGCPVPFLACTL